MFEFVKLESWKVGKFESDALRCSEPAELSAAIAESKGWK